MTSETSWDSLPIDNTSPLTCPGVAQWIPFPERCPWSVRECSGGMPWLVVWNCIFFELWIFNSEPEICWTSLCLLNYSGCLEISASEKYFSDYGRWPFHNPPIHISTKCRPINPGVTTQSVFFAERIYRISTLNLHSLNSLESCSLFCELTSI